MTPKEKAQELVSKFKPLCKDVKHTGILDGRATVMNDDVINFYSAKQCALIAVEPMIYFIESHNNEWHGWAEDLAFWKEVKQEIEKL